MFASLAACHGSSPIRCDAHLLLTTPIEEQHVMSIPPTSPPERPPSQEFTRDGVCGKRRNPVLVWLVWPIITLGIYHLVWWYKINREVHDYDQRIDVSPALSVLALVPGFLIIVPPYISIWKTGDRIRSAQTAAGLSERCNPWIGLILSFIFGLHSLYYQMSLNSLWQSYGTPEEGTVVPLRA